MNTLHGANLNTAVATGGFILTIATVVFLTGQNSAKIEQQQIAMAAQWSDFQRRQEAYNANFDSDRRAAREAYDSKMDSITGLLTQLSVAEDQHTGKIAALEKKDDEFDLRIARIAESYGNKYSDISQSLGAINIQLALLSQTVAELKQAVDPSPPRPAQH